MRLDNELTSESSVETAPNASDTTAGGRVAVAVLTGAWIVILTLYLRHAIVQSSDSMNNYAHVWWIARDLWHHGRLPWRMPVLGHGDAYTYPYGFVNWTTAALVWPLFGNWAITLWTALGAVLCVVGTFTAFPELRHPWWAAAVLANSAIVEALLFGQQSFAWGAALLLFGVACWRRGRRGIAAVLVGVGQATHAAIVLPIGIVLVLLYLPFTRDRKAVLGWYALSVAITLPPIVLVFASPGYADTPAGSRLLNFWITLGPRVLVVVLPLFYVLLRRTGVRAFAPLALVVSLGWNIGLEAPLNVIFQWQALTRSVETPALDAFLRSDRFERGATYRVLRGAGDGKLGLYKVIRAGGRLDSELFPESMAIRDFHSVADYERLLCDRHVDYILHFRSYDVSRHTNEHTVIDRLAAATGAPVRLRLVERRPGHEFYGVDRRRCPA